MSTTPAKNKARTTAQSKVNPTVEKTQARADANLDTRVSIGIGPSGVWGADDGIIVADHVVEPQAPEDETPTTEG